MTFNAKLAREADIRQQAYLFDSDSSGSVNLTG